MNAFPPDHSACGPAECWARRALATVVGCLRLDAPCQTGVQFTEVTGAGPAVAQPKKAASRLG